MTNEYWVECDVCQKKFWFKSRDDVVVVMTRCRDCKPGEDQ